MTGGTEREGRFAKPDGRPLSIVVAGGGTAGHIEPALAVADAIREIAPDARITALGTNRGLETTLVPARGYDLRLIPPVPVPRKPTGDLFKLPLRVARAVSEARAVLDDVEADAVIGFGGYVSAPAYLACRRGRRIPFLVHEANARAGMANKLGVKLGGEGLTAVSGSGMAGDIVGIPVRRALSTLDRAALRAEAREFFGLPVDGPVLFVTGGSPSPTGGRCPSSSPAAGPPATSSPRWPWPTRSARSPRTRASRRWAPTAAWRPPWSPPAATTCG